jgi:hypothetical protein
MVALKLFATRSTLWSATLKQALADVVEASPCNLSVACVISVWMLWSASVACELASDRVQLGLVPRGDSVLLAGNGVLLALDSRVSRIAASASAARAACSSRSA